MSRMRWLAPLCLVCLLPAAASGAPADGFLSSDHLTAVFWRAEVAPIAAAPARLTAIASVRRGFDEQPELAGDATDAIQTARPRPVAFEYSDGYRLRARIHRYASFASLPLFAGEAIVGQSLYTNPTRSRRDTHLLLAGALGGLFAANGVTGVWNLVEARKDPQGRTRRWIHALLMLGADAGFVATAALAPESEFGERERGGFSDGGRRGTHRVVALTSIGLATAGYLVMLLGGR